VKIETTRQYDRGLAALPAALQEQVIEAIPDLVEAFGKPHAHRGLRKLGCRLYEFRVGLAWRLVFRHDGDTLFFLLIGAHDDVRRFIRSF